ncbi:MAG: hypothetical protein ACKO5E_12055, partial [bacterium]
MKIRSIKYHSIRSLAFVIFIFAMTLSSLAQDDSQGKTDRRGANPSTPVRKPGQRREIPPQSPVGDPRRWVFIAVVAFLLLGGARKWLAASRGRKMADRIADGQASLDEIRQAARHGRAVLPDLLGMLADGKSDEMKSAAFESLIQLWQADELIAEEEKAIITRAFQVEWKQRRKYPRDYDGNFQILGFISLPKIQDESRIVWLSEHLRWETRVTGTRKATDDQWQMIPPDEMQLQIQMESRDFPEDCVHRVMLFTRVTTHGLTSNWTLDLPGQATSFEWDQHLKSAALKADFDEKEALIMQEALTWDCNADPDTIGSQLIALSPGFAIHRPPVALLRIPLPRDLAHDAVLEIDEISSKIKLKNYVIASRGSAITLQKQFKMIPLEIKRLIDDSAISRAGKYRARINLQPR